MNSKVLNFKVSITAAELMVNHSKTAALFRRHCPFPRDATSEAQVIPDDIAIGLIVTMVLQHLLQDMECRACLARDGGCTGAHSLLSQRIVTEVQGPASMHTNPPPISI